MGLDLGWLLAIAIVLLVVWKEGNRILAPVIGPLVALLGRAYGATVGNYLEQRRETQLCGESEDVTPSQSQVTQSNHVTQVTCTDLDLVWIAYELAKGSTPSATAKTLPGYSPDNYQTFAGKVGEVEALLAEKSAIEQQRAAKKAAKVQANRSNTAMIREQSI